MAVEEELRWRIRELLVPEGEPVGEPGRRVGVQVVGGGLEAAEELFNQLREWGEVERVASYSGSLVRLGGEGRVGFRPTSKSGEPTIDVTLECVPEIIKIKFVRDVAR